MRMIAGILANALGILLASLSIPGFVFSGSFVVLLATGALLSLANTVIRPLLKLLSLPLIILTLGLFAIIVNMAVLWLVDIFIGSLTISFGALFWGTLLISLLHTLLVSFVRPTSQP